MSDNEFFSKMKENEQRLNRLRSEISLLAREIDARNKENEEYLNQIEAILQNRGYKI